MFFQVRFDRTELIKNIEILKKFGFRELMFNSIRSGSAKEARKVLEIHCSRLNLFLFSLVLFLERIKSYDILQIRSIRIWLTLFSRLLKKNIHKTCRLHFEKNYKVTKFVI